MEKEHEQTDNLFDHVISVYTQDQAIDDGILVPVGRLNTGQQVVFTRNLFETGGYEDLEKRLDLIQTGIAMLNKSDSEDSPYMRLRVIEKGQIWVIADGNGLTFLKPEDY
ncbi:hypothetical protein BVY01_00165 [bacterium I07]|nr:hypothetical protein BVY01_00165 [bacterium I07]